VLPLAWAKIRRRSTFEVDLRNRHQVVVWCCLPARVVSAAPSRSRQGLLGFVVARWG
jgi:hypothetical protein